MSDIAEQYDYWNHRTAISIGNLDVLKVIAKPTNNPDQVNVGQLFTAIAYMMTQNDENVEVCVTGYLRGVMEKDNPRPWQAKDCYAPRNHHNGVPPVRLLKYPRNLRNDNGDRLLTIDLSKLITDQLANDDGWREQICSKVDPVTLESIYDCLGLEIPQPESQQAEPEAEETAEAPDQVESKDDEIDLDSLELEDEDANIDQLDTAAESELESEEETIDLDAQSSEDDDDDSDDMGSLVDQWDEEDADDDLSALDSQSKTQEALEDLSEMDDDSDIVAHNPEQTAPVNRAAEVAGRFDWGADSTKTENQSTDAPVLTEEAEASPEQAGPIDKAEPVSPQDQPEPVDKPVAGNPEPSKPSPAPTAADKTAGPSGENVRQFVRQDKPAVAKPAPTSAPTPAATAESSNESASSENVVAREHILFNADTYDVGFMGFEHGESSVKDQSGEQGTLFTTRGGLVVVHIDGMKVVELKPEQKEQLFSILGYDVDAKRAYASAKIDCVRWLD